jgi:ribosomal protein L11 methyltransferase
LPDRDIELLDDEDLADASRQVIRPVRIGPRLTIVPAEDFPADARADTLALHMGLAFGTGQHPTTRLCLEWLEREVRGAETILDYGCGTGILALAALRLGAARATAIDNEPQALDAARANAILNRLESRIVIAPPERLGETSFDIILANILAQPLIELAESFAARQTPRARIALSGLLAPQLDLVEAAYAPFYEPTDRRELSGWGLLIAERNEYDR